MWIDRTTYWGWAGGPDGYGPPPVKRVRYADVIYSYTHMSIACGVFDGEEYTPLNVDEIDWHRSNGAAVILAD